MRIRNLYLIAFLGLINIAMAQQPLSLYYLENVPQTTTINPAMVPRANGFFGVPGINSVYGGIYTDLLGHDFIQTVDGENVTPLKNNFDYAKLYDEIGDAANFTAYEIVAPFVFGFSGKKGYFTFTVNEKLNQSIALPKDFLSVIEKGIPVGTDLDFSPLALNGQYYREWSFGYSYNFMSKLRVGIHAKLLQGIAAIKTDINTFNFRVKSDDEGRHFSQEIDFDGTFYLSAPLSFETDENGTPKSPKMKDLGKMSDILNTAVFNFKNPGFAADIGVAYDYNSAWTFSGSVNDIGFIKWNGDLSTISANSSFTYDGVTIDGSRIEELGGVFEQFMDSTKSGLSTKLTDKGFSTGLAPKAYLGAQYHVNHYFSAGAVSRTMFAKNNFSQEFNVSANLNLYHVLTTTLNYTLAVNGANTIGFGFALRGGPLQFYMVADYLPYKYRSVSIRSDDGNGSTAEIPFTPEKIDNFNVMFGLNLLFGANGFRDEPMIDAYNEF